MEAVMSWASQDNYVISFFNILCAYDAVYAVGRVSFDCGESPDDLRVHSEMRIELAGVIEEGKDHQREKN